MSKLFEGKVISLKNLNTLIVSVVSQHIHPLYKKRLKRNKNYKIQYTDNQAVIGDTVQFCETKHISRDKKYKFIKVLTK